MQQSCRWGVDHWASSSIKRSILREDLELELAHQFHWVSTSGPIARVVAATRAIAVHGLHTITHQSIPQSFHQDHTLQKTDLQEQRSPGLIAKDANYYIKSRENASKDGRLQRAYLKNAQGARAIRVASHLNYQGYRHVSRLNQKGKCWRDIVKPTSITVSKCRCWCGWTR